jgi:hypothetical protein
VAARAGQAGADAGFAPASVTRYGKTATIGGGHHVSLWYGLFSIWSGRAGEYSGGRVSAAVSAADGHGMILIERRVD